ncbi:ankyrin repeat-containing protein [Anaeramoeba flamelloides]|uniref:Ankyrin repeat-containing protein n=1 Tax=Anaeramoeba flamelloides TaxID=1746091 RepID=A0AAV7ZME0_9EUKA|nr:ankyrin repeat-containing protein [Anaeramoeba flamelloides]
MYRLRFRRKIELKNLFKKLTKKNINKCYGRDNLTTTQILLKSRNPRLKDLKKIFLLGSKDLSQKHSFRQKPLNILVLGNTPLRKDLVYCLFDNCPTKIVLDSLFFQFIDLFMLLQKECYFENLIDFLKLTLVYWFEKKKEKRLMKISKEIKKENTQVKEKETENKQEKKKQKQRKHNSISLILDCLNNKEDLITIKELMKKNEISLHYHDKKTRLNLLHALILSNKCDNLELKMEIIKEIVDQNKSKKILNQKINWVNYSELHLLSMCLVTPDFAVELAKLLLKSGSNICIVDNNNITPFYLHLQQEKINENLIRLYLECVDDINKLNLKEFTSNNNNINNNNYNLSLRCEQNKTLFQLFCQHECNSIELYKLFIQKGVKAKIIENSNPTHSLLNIVCRRANPTLEIIKLLREHGANIIDSNLSPKPSFRQTTLVILIMNEKCGEKYQIIKYFLKNGVDLSIKTKDSKYNILHYLCISSNFPKFEQCLELLLNKTKDLTNDININSANISSKTPLNFLMKYYTKISVPFLEMLINDFGCDLINNYSQKYGFKYYPLMSYFFRNDFNPKIADFFISQFGNHDFLSQISTLNTNMFHVLSKTVYINPDKFIYLYQRCNVKLDLKSKKTNETALHIVCRNTSCSTAIIGFFIQNGLNINQLNRFKKTPLNIFIAFIINKFIEFVEW